MRRLSYHPAPRSLPGCKTRRASAFYPELPEEFRKREPTKGVREMALELMWAFLCV